MHSSAKSDAISNEFHNFLADIESMLKETANLSGEELSQAKEKIQQRVSAAKEAAVHLGCNIADGAEKIAASANREVNAEPWKAIGVGAIAGLLLGVLFARR